MPVTDDPNSRIKAADAKAFWEALKRGASPAWAHLLLHEHKLRGVAAFSFWNTGSAGRRNPDAWGQTEADRGVLLDWADRIALNLPDHLNLQKGAVIVAVHADGVVDVATHGVTSRACRAFGEFGKVLAERLLSVAPFQTWFGWGHQGQPVRISEEAYAGLSRDQQAYVDRVTHREAI